MIRGIGLRGAVAVNTITMIGIGPLITIPLVLSSLHGSAALAGWIVGAIIALCDGLVWAELGSQFPSSGGTYAFLRDGLGAERWGRLGAFLFTWQIVLSAPLLLATGYIGFAQYAAYLWPALGANATLQGAIAACVGAVTVLVLYRPIGSIARLSVGLGVIATLTLCTVIAAALAHFSAAQAASGDPHVALGATLAGGLGPALIIALYDYYGYGAACTLGEEVRRPAITLPRAVVISIVLVALLYIGLQTAVLGSVPWQKLVSTTPGGDVPANAKYVAATIVENAAGIGWARFVTIAILLTAFASTFGNLLAYSRIPFAAARDGLFFKAFGKLHERAHFPHVSLLTIGLLALPASFLSLGDAINALTAGLVIVQSLGQILVLFALRSRGVKAPYRMWLFPVPAVITAAGWVYIFFSAGSKAIAFGLLTLLAGIVVYLWRARVARMWPFAVAASVLTLLLVGGALCTGSPAIAAVTPLHAGTSVASASWNSAAIVQRNGYPIFEVNRKPFFVYGAAFFYERMPPSQWRGSLERLRTLGFNTLDLYVPWNWHELSDGNFDFTGRTNPRRNLRALLRLVRADGFKIILRPGPVIRNEWRNGGYPAWLLERPEYGMPQHDLLEGRYPPTATLQNANSDDAAAQWLSNGTHMRYAKRWLRRVLPEFSPVADRVVAIALDDDQGAYIDNQTWPAPHLRAYLQWLGTVVHNVTGPHVPLFINTYDMKVTASSPVWAMGNWYQSEAYTLGEHDLGQLAFATGLLQTQSQMPVMLSEFQAGWLEQPGDVLPRPADPRNTTLALQTALGLGAHGVVVFPAQDTQYPDGWEVPFANAFYAWDAGLDVNGRETPRGQALAAFGAFVSSYGRYVAQTHVIADAAIAYLTSAFDEHAIDNADIGAIAAATQDAQKRCRALSLTCDLVDLRYADDATLQRYPLVIVPIPDRDSSAIHTLRPREAARLQVLVRKGHSVVAIGTRVLAGLPNDAIVGSALDDATVTRALAHAHAWRTLSGMPGATLLAGGGHAFVLAANYGERPEAVPKTTVLLPGNLRIAQTTGVRAAAIVDTLFTVPAQTIAARSILTLAVPKAASFTAQVHQPTPHTPAGPVHKLAGLLNCPQYAQLPVRRDTSICAHGLHPAANSGAVAYTADLFEAGTPEVVLQNDRVRIVVAPEAGGRAFVFEDLATRRSSFTTVGALRDDAAVQPPPSPTDKIAKYTNTFPAGMFNRSYRAEILETGRRAVVRVRYHAPDVLPAGATFERTLTLEPGSRTLEVDETVTFDNGATLLPDQAGVTLSSLAVGSPRNMTTQQLLLPAPSPFAPNTSPAMTTNGFGFFDTASGELAIVAWDASNVHNPSVAERTDSVVFRAEMSQKLRAHFEYTYEHAHDRDSARAAVERAISSVGTAKQSP